MFTKLINLTPHDVNLVGDDGLTVTIPAEDTPARASEQYTETGEHEGGHPRVKLSYGDVTGLPDPVQGTVYIVSNIVAVALPDRTDLVWPAGIVRGEGGVITGCRVLASL